MDYSIIVHLLYSKGCFDFATTCLSLIVYELTKNVENFCKNKEKEIFELLDCDTL